MNLSEFLVKLKVLFEGKKEIKEAEQALKRFKSAATEVGITTSKALKGMNIQTARVSKALETQHAVVTKWTDVIKTADGRIYQVVTAQKKLDGKLEDTTRTITDITGKTKTFAQNLSDLARRAALVIPIWYALRRVYMQFIEGINLGLKRIEELSYGLTRARVVMHGITDVEGFMRRLQKAAEEMSYQTGLSVRQILEAFYRFGTAGIKAENALSGMNAAIKTAVAMMGDSTEIARIMADIYNNLGDTITEVTSEADKFNYIGAIMFKLWQNNAFEAREFARALENVIGRTKVAGLNFKEIVALTATLHTLMIRAGKAGTQIGRAFQMMIKNVDRIRNKLGLVVDVRRANMYDVFVEVLKRLKQIRDEMGGEAGKANIADLINEIFGIRGTTAVGLFVDNLDMLIETLESVKEAGYDALMNNLNKFFKLQTERVDVLVNRIKELRKELGKQFVIGFTGTEDFEQALERIIHYLEKIVNIVRKNRDIFGMMGRGGIVGAITGLAVGGFVGHPFVGALLGFLAGQSVGATMGTTERIAKSMMKSSIGKDLATVGKANAQIAQHMQEIVKLANIIVKDKEEEKKKDEVILDTREKIKFTYEEQEELLNRLKTLGYTELEIEMLRYKYYKDVLKLSEEDEELQKQKLKVIQAINKELIRGAEEVRNAFQDAFKAVLGGQKSLGEFMSIINKNIKKAFVESMAEGLTNMIMRVTGIGEMFGGLFFRMRTVGTNIMEASKASSVYFYEAITKGGIYAAQVIGEAVAAGATPTGSPPPFSPSVGIGALGFGGSFWGGGGLSLLGFLNKPAFYNYGTREQIGSRYGYRKYPGPSWGQLLGLGMTTYMSTGALGPLGGLGTAMMGISNLAQAGLIRGALGAWGTSWMGPLGLGLTFASMLFSMGKTREQVQEQQRTMQVASRIDVTNKTLDIINRNLIALRSDIRTYILPESAAFAEKQNIEDQFALNARRGLNP